jgi:hypothetical protein
MKSKIAATILLFISMLALIYPAAFWISWIRFWNDHSKYPPLLKGKEFAKEYPIFTNNYPPEKIAAILALISIISGGIALGKLRGRSLFIPGLLLVIIAAGIFLLSLFTMM